MAVSLSASVGRASTLKVLLFVSDAVGLSLAWALAVTLRHIAWQGRTALLLGVGLLAVAASMTALRHHGLYLARVSSQRTIEARGIVRACLLGAGLTAALASLELPIDVVFAGIYFATSSGLLLLSRSVYRLWLSTRRRSGRYVRPVIVVGANEEATKFMELVDDHPELGYRITDVLGDGPAGSRTTGIGGQIEDAVGVARQSGATGAVVIASALTAAQLHAVTRDLLAAGMHVNVSSGLAGLSRTRIRPVSFAHEALLYLEPSALRAWQRRLKRAIDLTVSAVVLLMSMPLWLAVAALIKLDSSGPVFFAQERVGMDGRPFRILKFRTMRPNAETALFELVSSNERADSPLFKMASDPRVTRVGRVLRATSLDELPQLLNVLSGTMSIVGPRPALPSEVEHFDDELKARTRVKPGITGLWQIEARDHPSFGPYRRLDLFYVENWSLSLDLLILAGTVTSVGARICRFLVPSLGTAAAMRPQ